MDDLPVSVFEAYGASGATVKPLGTGLINRTWLLTAADGSKSVLQQVNSMFAPQLNRDIDVVTGHVSAKGLTTPLLRKTVSGDLWVEEGGSIWRMLDYIDGDVFDELQSPEQAREAGLLMARFHVAIDDLEYEFSNARPGVHDTAAHLKRLNAALANHRNSNHYSETASLANKILDAAENQMILDKLPDRNVHGDPKISNLMFDRETGAGLCVLDFDTLTRMPLPLEMGDAFRSWCNPCGEDTTDARFSLDLFASAVGGYADVTRGWIQEIEWRAFVVATETICLELAARFCADALNESYFEWNPDRFASRFEHNIVRATGQLNAARSLAAQEPDAEKVVFDAFAS